MNMKYSVLIILLLIPNLISASPPEHEINSIVQVYSPGVFTCRVTDWPNVGAVRLRVSIKGIEPAESSNKNETVKFVKQYLKQAESIKLRNIEHGSYFRVKADVIVDGKDLSSQLIRMGMARGIEVKKEVPEEHPVQINRSTIAAEKQQRKVELLKQRLGLNSTQKTTAGRPRTEYVRLSELLNTTINLSAWNRDMTFDDALKILSDSTDPAVPIVVMWSDLNNNAFVDKNTPIGLSGVRSIPVKKALQLLVLSVGKGPGNVECVPQDGIVTIASANMGLSKRMVTRIYDTGEILAPVGSMLSGMGMGNNMGGMGSYGMGSIGGYGMGSMGNLSMGMGSFGNSGFGFGNRR